MRSSPWSTSSTIADVDKEFTEALLNREKRKQSESTKRSEESLSESGFLDRAFTTAHAFDKFVGERSNLENATEDGKQQDQVMKRLQRRRQRLGESATP